MSCRNVEVLNERASLRFLKRCLKEAHLFDIHSIKKGDKLYRGLYPRLAGGDDSLL